MIQRKQSVFLLLAIIALVIALFEMSTSFVTATEHIHLATLSNFALSDGRTSNYLYSVMGAMLIIVAVISAVTIFAYHNRKFQMRMCWWMVFVLLIYYIVRMSCVISLAKTLKLMPVFDFYDAFPLFALIMVVAAYRGVKHDDKLVRDSYRIR